ncbi:MAG: hypothetical protein HY369_01330 [Candidatus Aenigmarchaeota archaeon]|nr:hypothetical protein [Candidatus Aenigmarchaeota archaeon]
MTTATDRAPKPALQRFVGLEARVWSASILNAVFMASQLRTLLVTRDATGLDLVMLAGFCYMQVTFAQLGWHTRQWAMFLGMAASALITAAIFILALAFR